VTDILFRWQDGQFIGFLNNTDLKTAKAVGDRIQHAICQSPVMAAGTVLSVSVLIASVSIPQDGRSLSELVSAAHKRVPPAPSTSPPNVH
jgi:GGDEF domain-containing protein